MDTFVLLKESVFWRERETRTLQNSGSNLFPLARGGRSVESLARQCEPYAATIHDWVKRASINDGERDDCLAYAEIGRVSPVALRGKTTASGPRYFGPISV